jgi:23S rRNA pseudouridine1911/1915/1917 synthase
MRPQIFSLIYEDNHLLVANKPAGLLTQPSGTEQDSLEAQAKDWVKKKYNKPGEVFLVAVHRLDKPVSGVVLFARTSKALSRLNEAMRNKNVRKIYYALVEGMLPQTEGLLEHYMIDDEYRAQVLTKATPEAKLAQLRYRLLRREPGMSLVEVDLKTGRYHQIRAQLAEVGCPIVGDEKYGSQKKLLLPGVIALHHFCLEVGHPVGNQPMHFEASLPDFWPIDDVSI